MNHAGYNGCAGNMNVPGGAIGFDGEKKDKIDQKGSDHAIELLRVLLSGGAAGGPNDPAGLFTDLP
jgi:hypothetical protein